MTSFSPTLSVLSDHVGGVVGGCTKEKMVWSHTRRVVATMENIKPIWNRSDIDGPRGSMRKRGTLSALFGYGSVGSTIGPNPEPAGIGFPDVFPESVLERNPSMGISALPTAKFLRLTFEYAKRLVAKFTVAVNGIFCSTFGVGHRNSSLVALFWAALSTRAASPYNTTCLSGSYR